MTMTMKTMATTMIVAAGLVGAAVAQTSHEGYGSSQSTAAQAPMPMGQMDMNSMQQVMQSMMPAPNDTPATKDYKAADMAMMHNMNAPYSGNPDIDFRRKMIPHHQGAIDMAKVALQHAKDPETKRMARKIIDDQQKEIAEMLDWLKKHGG
jgi:uncharacterized protein (DUF305 family)